MNIKALGIDIEGNVFKLHGVDTNSKTFFMKRLTRKKLPKLSAITYLLNWYCLWWISLLGRKV